MIIFAGKDYGMGSSRDWAAKGTALLGVKAVVANSFERIHRSNLIMMGVLPLQFQEGTNAENLGLTGDELCTIIGNINPQAKVSLEIAKEGKVQQIPLLCRIDTASEADYFRNGGILPYVLRGML